MTNVPGVFVAGDMGRGQSLIVWAIAEGRVVRRRRRPLADGRDGPAGADRTHEQAARLSRHGAARRRHHRDMP